MRFSWGQRKRTEGLVRVDSAVSDDEEKNHVGLMTGVEKGFCEAFLFALSVILHLSNSLKEERVAEL